MMSVIMKSWLFLLWIDTCMAAIKYDVSNNEIMAILAVDATFFFFIPGSEHERSAYNHSANN